FQPQHLRNTIKQYVNCNVFSNTTAIYDLIECNADDIAMEILNYDQYDHYVPTIGFYRKNLLIKAIEMCKISLIQQIMKYCLHYCFNKNKPGFMFIVVDALPHLAIKYPDMLSILMKQLTYAKVPVSWKVKNNDFQIF